MEELLVKEIMTRGAVTCNPEMTLTEVARLLSDADVSAIVVVDRQGRLQGIVSQFDLLGYLGKDLDAVTAGEIMTAPVVSVLPDDTVRHAADGMRKHRVHRLVVTDEEKTRVLGVVSATDVIHTMRGLGV